MSRDRKQKTGNELWKDEKILSISINHEQILKKIYPVISDKCCGQKKGGGGVIIVKKPITIHYNGNGGLKNITISIRFSVGNGKA